MSQHFKNPRQDKDLWLYVQSDLKGKQLSPVYVYDLEGKLLRKEPAVPPGPVRKRGRPLKGGPDRFGKYWSNLVTVAR